MDPRLLMNGLDSDGRLVSLIGSKIAFAVLGRESPRVLGNGKVRRSLFGGLMLTVVGGVNVPPETIELREFDTECDGRIVTVLDVSLETRLNGLGINSTLSEKPTRARFSALLGEASSLLLDLAKPRPPGWLS